MLAVEILKEAFWRHFGGIYAAFLSLAVAATAARLEPLTLGCRGECSSTVPIQLAVIFMRL